MSFDTQKQQGDRARVGKQLKQREHQRSVRVDTVPAEGVALWRMRHRCYDRLANKSIRKATAASMASFDGQLSSSPSSRRSPDHAPNWTFLISRRTINRIVEAEMETIHREFTAAVATAQSHPPIVEATRKHVPVLTNPLATAGWAYTSRDAYNGCRTLLVWGGRPLQQHQQQPDAQARPHRRNDALQIFQQAAVVRSICHKAEACEPSDMHRQHLVMEACRALGKVDSRTDRSRAQPGTPSPSRPRGMVSTRKSLRLPAVADFDCDDGFGDSDEAEECEQRFGEAARSGGEGSWSPELQPLPAVTSASEDEDDAGSDADEFILIDHRDVQALGAVELAAAAGTAEERSVLEADMEEQEQASSPPSGPIVLDLQQLLSKSKRASKRKMPAQQQHWQHLAKFAGDGRQEPQHEEWPELRARPVDEDAFVIV